MSGSDGPSQGGGGWGGGAAFQSDDCAALTFEGWLAAVSDDIKIEAGDVFGVVLGTTEPPTIHLMHGSDVVGTIRPIPAILRCLSSGFTYMATVLSADGGSVLVRVSAA